MSLVVSLVLNPDITLDSAAKDLLQRCIGMETLEEITMALLNQSISYTLADFGVEEDALTMTMSYDQSAGKRAEQVLGYMQLSSKVLKTQNGIHNLDEGILRLDDSGKLIEDKEWFDARWKRLRLSEDRISCHLVAPPKSFGELVLSYASMPFGMAAVRKDFRGFGRTSQFCWELTLQYAPGGDIAAEDGVMMRELYFVRQDLMQKLIDRRVAKKSVLKAPEVVAH